MWEKSREKQQEDSRDKAIEELNTVFEGVFPHYAKGTSYDGATWSGNNTGQENSCLFSCVSKGQHETQWCL